MLTGIPLGSYGAGGAVVRLYRNNSDLSALAVLEDVSGIAEESPSEGVEESISEGSQEDFLEKANEGDYEN